MMRKAFFTSSVAAMSVMLSACMADDGSVNSVSAVAPTEPEQTVPDDLTIMPDVSNAYQPATTPWGDPDFRGTWPLNDFAEVPVNRPPQYGNRFWKTAEEVADEQGRVSQLEEAYEAEDEEGTIGLGHWIEYKAGSLRTSMVVSPSNGRLPEWTDEGYRRSALMRASWVPGQTFDHWSDFDSWDRCVTRGFPASMFPFRYNNGVRIFQSPGYVVIVLEMLGTRVIPVGEGDHWPEAMSGWFGSSRGRWEDHNTLVVETNNIMPGASALNVATRGVPPNNVIPMSEETKVVERFHLIGPDTITYQMDYSDPVVWQAPFSMRVDWSRDDDYEFYEYACHEGNVQLRNYITASRAQREQEYARGRHVEPVNPGAAPPPAMDPASRGVGRRSE